ncbi:MAG TPA: VOC family protein [Caulobacteraceae bacterium]|nr:VOC family protein [Caulobacteraceae bacterium]
MRLRQVALIAHRVAPITAQLKTVFDLNVAYVDPGVEVFGLKNAVLPVGGEFLEVLEPFRGDASGARYLARRGGDAGYMVILQDADSYAHRDRLAAAGARVIARNPEGPYRFTHFHPADCAGALTSIDSIVGDENWRDRKSDWLAAGRDWRRHESGESLGVASVTIQSRDPVAACERWRELLDRPARTGGDTLEIPLERGVIRFTAPVDADGTGVVACDIEVKDPDATLARARAAGVPVAGGAVEICGVSLRPVAV